MSLQKVIQESIAGNPLEMKEALAEELRNRVAEALAAKMEEVELGEAFKRGDILHVPGAGGTKHPAVHLGTKAVYLDDEGAVEHVPHEALKNAEIAKRVPAKHKMLAKKYLDNMKEEVEELDEISKKTLASYVKKAGGADRNSLAQNIKSQMSAAAFGDRETYKQSQRAANNRSTGIQRAADRLAKE